MENISKVLMFKLNSGRFAKEHGFGSDWYNLNETDGSYYGIILNSGRHHDIYLQKMDAVATHTTPFIEGVLLIYVEDFNGATNIVAIGENSTVYRKEQTTPDEMYRNRSATNNRGETWHTGYHTVTKAENMHILDDDYIPLMIPKKDAYFFRAQRMAFQEKYNEIKNYIVDEAVKFLKNQ